MRSLWVSLLDGLGAHLNAPIFSTRVLTLTSTGLVGQPGPPIGWVVRVHRPGLASRPLKEDASSWTYRSSR